MNFTMFIANAWQQVPPGAKIFLKRVFFIFIAWKLLYHLLLFPLRFPDKQLTDITAASASFLYKHLINQHIVLYREGFNAGSFFSALYVQNNKVLSIADSCNGLEIHVLFIAFLFCIPTTFKRQIAFTLGGITGIFIINAFRCFGLAWLTVHHYSWFNFAHHYLFQILSYSIMFLGWVWYAKKS